MNEENLKFVLSIVLIIVAFGPMLYHGLKSFIFNTNDLKDFSNEGNNDNRK